MLDYLSQRTHCVGPSVTAKGGYLLIFLLDLDHWLLSLLDFAIHLEHRSGSGERAKRARTGRCC